MTYESSYGTARLVAKLISFFGWIVLAGSIIAGITIFSASERSDPAILAAVIGTAVGGFLSGIMLIATGQITRAVVDTADFNGETGIAKNRHQNYSGIAVRADQQS